MASCSARGSRSIAGRYQLQSRTTTSGLPMLAFSHSALTTVVSGDGDDDEAIATVAEEEWRARDECRDGRGRRATMQGDARVSAADIKVTADLDRGCVLGRPKGRTFVSGRGRRGRVAARRSANSGRESKTIRRKSQLTPPCCKANARRDSKLV